MALTGSRTFVGFGFGAIQAGLFLYEAFRSGHFKRLVVAEVLPNLVSEIRQAAGFCSVNVAHLDHVEVARVGPVEVYNPTRPEDREPLVRALAEAEEISTAVPSVTIYATDGPGSLHRTLAEGLARKAAEGKPRAVVYAAENHNHAAEILQELVLGEVPADQHDAVLAKVQFLNTVIGKMSGLIRDPAEDNLATITPKSGRAFLVEAFNRILVSEVRFDPPFRRGIDVFEEKPDLLPFEEAKLFGHNATHALAAYLGRLLGARRVADLRDVPGLLDFLRAAFLEESGEALIRKHRGLDPLFTPEGYTEYADDLLARMTNPFLMDTVERVGRDPRRKLGWEDRLIGTMRLARAQDIEPRRYAIGAAAAFAALDGAFLEGEAPVATWSGPLWETAGRAPAEVERVVDLIEAGRRFLRQWCRSEFADPQELFAHLA